MIHSTYSWETKDNINLFAQSWQPETEVHKTIALVHGLGEHSSRYHEWAEKFVENGYNFISFDLRGHGKSPGKRGHIKSMSQLLDDVDLMLQNAKSLFPGTKIILYGHSMGGNIVLNHVVIRNYPLDALIVTSPWLKLYHEPSYAKLYMVSLINRIYPSFTAKSNLNAEDISHDPVKIREYRSDPLNHNKISLRLFTEMFQGGYNALRNVYKINSPFLIMHGTADTITSPKASEKFVLNTSKRTRLKLWEDQFHELHNEFKKLEVFDYIIHWLKENKL